MAAEPDEFDGWIRPHWETMRRVADRMAVTAADRDGVLQNALTNAWRSRHTFDPCRGTLRAWLLAIVANEARKSSRWWRTPRLEPADHNPQTAGGDTELRQAVRELPHQQRTAIDLHYYVGLTIDENATALNSTRSQVKSTLASARAKPPPIATDGSLMSDELETRPAADAEHWRAHLEPAAPPSTIKQSSSPRHPIRWGSWAGVAAGVALVGLVAAAIAYLATRSPDSSPAGARPSMAAASPVTVGGSTPETTVNESNTAAASADPPCQQAALAATARSQTKPYGVTTIVSLRNTGAVRCGITARGPIVQLVDTSGTVLTTSAPESFDMGPRWFAIAPGQVVQFTVNWFHRCDPGLAPVSAITLYPIDIGRTPTGPSVSAPIGPDGLHATRYHSD